MHLTVYYRKRVRQKPRYALFSFVYFVSLFEIKFKTLFSKHG